MVETGFPPRVTNNVTTISSQGRHAVTGVLFDMKQAQDLNIPSSIVDECLIPLGNEPYSISNLPLSRLDEGSINPLQEFLKSDLRIQEFLSSGGDGLVSVSFEIPERFSPSRQMVLSAAIYHMINKSLFEPVMELKNALPYTAYKSSAKNIEDMKNAGIKFYSPEEKLGFHNDVFHFSGKYSIPKFVSLINLFIGYKDPGNFFYVHKEEWPEFDSLFNEAKGKRFKFRPTPVVYESELKNAAGLDRWSNVPAFWSNASGEKFAFCNGELKGWNGEDDEFVLRMKESLISCQKRINSQQTTFKAMLFRNDLGFHSRDIFQEQYVFSGTTRLFLRSVSKQVVSVPLLQASEEREVAIAS